MKTTNNIDNDLVDLEGKVNIEEYKCLKCRDLRFIIKDNEAIPCTCKEIREAEEILLNSGISEEFRRRRFDKKFKSCSI